jgi:hypothetical protein
MIPASPFIGWATTTVCPDEFSTATARHGTEEPDPPWAGTVTGSVGSVSAEMSGPEAGSGE